MSAAAKTGVVKHAYKSFLRTYGKPRKYKVLEPFHQLVACVLAHRSDEAAAQQGLDLLEKEFVDWNELRAASVEDLSEVLARAGIDSAAAMTLKGVLEAVFNRHFAMNLNLLEGVKHEEARRLMTEMESIPEQIISSTLLLTYRNLPVPVDEDIARVIRRLGAVKPAAALSSVDRLLRGLIARSESYTFFRTFTIHAQKTCHALNPDCANCTVRRFCQHGQDALEQARVEAAEERAAAVAAKKAEKEAAKKAAARKVAAKKAAAKKTKRIVKKSAKKAAAKKTAKKTAKKAARNPAAGAKKTVKKKPSKRTKSR